MIKDQRDMERITAGLESIFLWEDNFCQYESKFVGWQVKKYVKSSTFLSTEYSQRPQADWEYNRKTHKHRKRKPKSKARFANSNLNLDRRWPGRQVSRLTLPTRPSQYFIVHFLLKKKFKLYKIQSNVTIYTMKYRFGKTWTQCSIVVEGYYSCGRHFCYFPLNIVLVIWI